MRAAARSDDDRLRPEDVEVAIANVEAHGACDALRSRLVHQQVRDHDPVVDLAHGFARGLGDDGLVAFAVDHDLPLAFAEVAAGLRILEDRQTPFLELVHGRIDVTSDVVNEILPDKTHEVTARIADEILGLVLAPLHAHVAIDGGQPLRDGTASLDVRLLDEDDLQVAAPIARFVGGAASAKAAAHDEDVRIDEAGSSRHDVTPLRWRALEAPRCAAPRARAQAFASEAPVHRAPRMPRVP